MWDLPGPGLEPVSPALVGGFLTTAPPGKSYVILSESTPLRKPFPMLYFVLDVGYNFSAVTTLSNTPFRKQQHFYLQALLWCALSPMKPTCPHPPDYPLVTPVDH